MLFKNAQIYQLTGKLELDENELSEELSKVPSRECGTYEAETIGWEKPLGESGTLFTHFGNGCYMICAKGYEKIINAAAVNDLLRKKINEIQKSEDRNVRRRESLEIKEEIVHKLLPDAQQKPSLTYAYIDAKNSLFIVDSSSAKNAETVIALMRMTLGTFPCRPITLANNPSVIMTNWIQSHPPSSFVLTGNATLVDPASEGASINCKHQDLEADEIKAHIECCMQVTSLSMQWSDHITFTLTDDLAIKSMKYMDLIQNEITDTQVEDDKGRFDADFHIMTRELSDLIKILVTEMGGLYKDEDD